MPIIYKRQALVPAHTGTRLLLSPYMLFLHRH